MNSQSALQINGAPALTATPALTGSAWLEREAARLALALAGLLEQVASGSADRLADGVGFLRRHAAAVFADNGVEPGPDIDLDALPADSVMASLIRQYRLPGDEVQVILLSMLPSMHEGFADVIRMVNPRQKPEVAVGLAAHLFCPGGDRHRIEELLYQGIALRSGLIRVEDDGPFFDRGIIAAPALLPVLKGFDVWPAGINPLTEPVVSTGLEEWLDAVRDDGAAAALTGDAAITLRISAVSTEAACFRAAALVRWCGRRPAVFRLGADVRSDMLNALLLHCTARGRVPVLDFEPGEAGANADIGPLESCPGVAVLVEGPDSAFSGGERPVVQVESTQPGVTALTRMWSTLLDVDAQRGRELAIRFPLEPYQAARVATDLSRGGGNRELADVAFQVRVRAAPGGQAGIKLIRPRAGWDDLVLKQDCLAQLKDSALRLKHQARVLEDWGFLKNRHGARGVRMLLAGPPGTGKSLSAEVLAREIGVDLLVVDISRMVSKWIGETEKNLERAFACAEQTRAVLLFDEADALFGKRTDVSDSHDRYANLETAYLLARLERFEGLAIMSTNLRDNIDSAFTRRMEYIISFEEPGRGERQQIWQCHMPEGAPLAADVNLAELAAMFPVVGGVIRNAAVAAAFRAAAQDQWIRRQYLIDALRREYAKQGKSFPGLEASS